MSRRSTDATAQRNAGTKQVIPALSKADDIAAGAIPLRVSEIRANVLRELLKVAAQPGIISLAGGMPAADLFDVEGIRDATQRVMIHAAEQALQYGGSEGSKLLREAIATFMARAGCDDVDATEIVITTGATQAIDLVGRTLLDPGDTLAVEQPTFLATLNMAQLAAARIVGVPTDREGIDLVALEEIVATQRVKVLYVIPTFSNPSGTVMPMQRRQRLLEIAASFDVIVVEDDPYGHLWFDEQPPPPLLATAQTLKRPPVCLYIGSLSKTLAPGLRIGWVVAPPVLHERITVVKQIADAHTSSLDQAIALEYLESGRLDANLARARRAYAERAGWLGKALTRRLPNDLLEFAEPTGGMFLWCRLPRHHDGTVVRRALDRDLAIVPGTPFFAERVKTQFLRLSYAALLSETVADEATARLEAALGDDPDG